MHAVLVQAQSGHVNHIISRTIQKVAYLAQGLVCRTSVPECAHAYNPIMVVETWLKET